MKKNYKLMFWLQAFLNFKVMNVVMTLFYLHRGLTLAEIFYLAIAWAVVGLLFEVPSSYLADRWGRKKTMILGVALACFQWIIMLFAADFLWFIVAAGLLSLSFACFTGTDEALLYDTNKELGNEGNSLEKLGKYYSGQRIFKIFMPVIGALVAKDLLEWQFDILIALEFVASVASLIFAFRLVEPNHHVDVEKMEAGVMKDAVKLIRSDWQFMKAILSKTLIFIASFIIWRFHQEFFVNIGISVLTLGIGWGIFHAVVFFLNQYVSSFLKNKSLARRINLINAGFVAAAALLVLELVFLRNGYVMLITFFVMDMFEVMRWPLYSEFYNKKCCAFNRATTLSLSNFIKSVFDIPLLFIGAWLISENIEYPFVFSFAIGLFVIIFFRVRKVKQPCVKLEKV
ncbi:MAG TPA: MFS transporter [Candidatus Bipolaricaulota bacterium]|nr:MFS transporter [Candidatus Bipolaricaulota bacterium]